MSDLIDEIRTVLSGSYEVERELGQGGMATVYLAQDLKHHRKVAVKVLRPELAAILGGERFLKEIEVTAGLQHPNILPLYDSGEAGSFLYYVMPYLEGESLRDKLDREKQFGLEETIQLAKEICAALSFAHERGVVHRDIKPENIMLQAGQALVADFGIALAVSHAGGTRLTETGLSLGTPHYMSPEQATGDRDVDARSDIYSLGAMVYEMLTGDPPHTATTMQAIIAKVLTDTPAPISNTRDLIPPNVESAVARALAKTPADRFTKASDFAAALTDPSFSIVTRATPAPEKRTSPWNRLTIVTSAIAVVAVLVAAIASTESDEKADQVLRYAMVLEDGAGLTYTGSSNPPRLALLPDGSGIVYTGENAAATGDGARAARILWYRDFSRLESRRMPGTEGAWEPVVSPDGDRVAFRVRDTDADGIKVVSLAGGPPIALVDSGIGSAPTWGADDFIYYFDSNGRELRRVPASGGFFETVARFDVTDRRYDYMQVLPGGRTAVATSFDHEVGAARPTGTQIESLAGLEVHGLELQTGEARVLVQGFSPQYSPSGHLLYVTPEGTLMAVEFNPRTLEVEGRPVALLQGIDVRGDGFTDLTVSRNGVLAYATVGINTPEQIVWVDRNGVPTVVDTNWTRDEEFEGVSISPDGDRLAVEIVTAGRSDIWIKQLDDGPLSRLTFDGVDNVVPSWSPDGEYVAFASIRSNSQDAYLRRADGAGSSELLVGFDRDVDEIRWTPDQSSMVVAVGGRPSDDLYLLEAGATEPVPLLTSEHDEFEPRISPDGRWLAYVSDESGQSEVYVRPFPNVDDGRWLISTDGGKEPVWRRDGGELYYRSIDNTQVSAVDMSGGPGNASRRVLFTLPIPNDYESNPRNHLFDVAPDGRFMLIQRTGSPDISGELVIVRGFDRELNAAN